MLRGLIIIAIAIFAQLSRAASFEFIITKKLINGEKLKKEDWICVEVTKSDNFSVTVNVPLLLPYSDASIFFANEKKEILQVHLNGTAQGKFYSMPYQIQREMKGEKLSIIETDKFRQISGNFSESWMPKNVAKISAAVTSPDGDVYNYYGLRNYEISIQDLLVVEEYTKYDPST